ncbi:4'-phosphopantetheinyl transferase [Myxococcus fulvus]|uniref:4'-phosphopantetheinyl transferase n=1 Tax=Myxococcus fulvus TaxID=33 RepID=A0A511TAV1_MYXFU|nr:4'-phosphopantetheinyl transferase superfamily protein [Myxococcus fulvus]AKF81922.1 4-phosphopantetheinyl transferase [Myxococcus fulvus 124B02]GEN10612.1 4'-phosphopantetheinyl transferase [Myxococcus fulvus]SET78689.1 4'-phosphopantetheinyl transferase [Myxococcus fulvus]
MSTVAPLELGPDEVHVWIVEPERILERHLLDAYWGLLDSAEREKQQRFRFERHQKQYLVSHALVRLTLSRYAPVPPTAWSFSTNAYGRPEIRGEHGARLRFNLSHTDGMALVAVGLDAELGADVEDAERKGETVEIADSFFAAPEVAALKALPESEQRGRFFEYWTLKESYIKARGAGLSLPLDQFAFHLEAGREPRISFDARMKDTPQTWRFMQLRPSARHQAAVAMRRPWDQPFRVRWQFTVPLASDAPPRFEAAQGLTPGSTSTG